MLLPNFCVLPALSSHLSVFSKLCIMNTSLHFLLLLCQSCCSLRNISFGSGILGLTKSAYHGWLSMTTSSEGPRFQVLPRAPPILNPSLTIAYVLILYLQSTYPKIANLIQILYIVCRALGCFKGGSCERFVIDVMQISTTRRAGFN